MLKNSRITASEWKILALICVGLSVFVGVSIIKDKIQIEHNLATENLPRQPALSGACSDFAKEEVEKKAWIRYFDKCIKEEKTKKEIVNKIEREKKDERMDIVGEKTHTSVRFLSSDKECLNKALVFRLFFENGKLKKYKFSYGLINI